MTEKGQPTKRRAGPLRVLFVCSRNRRRSPTAEQVFADYPGVETASAGLAQDADEVLTIEHLEWADLIVLMEAVHRRRLVRRFGPHLRHARLACLNIADNYDFMDASLIALLRARVAPLLGGQTGRRAPGPDRGEG